MSTTTSTQVVALGDSITRAQVSADYVNMLQERTAGRRFEFTNADVNGELAYNVLGRLNAIVARQPDVVTVLVGTNDANASLSEKNIRMFMRMKKLPVRPTIGWYRENLTAISSGSPRRPTRESPSSPSRCSDRSSGPNQYRGRPSTARWSGRSPRPRDSPTFHCTRGRRSTFVRPVRSPASVSGTAGPCRAGPQCSISCCAARSTASRGAGAWS